MKPDLLIRDPEYMTALDDMGFCVAPLFSQAQIDQIKELYHEFSIQNNVSGLIASHSKIGGDKNLRLSGALRDIVMPALSEWFSDFDFFIGGFMVKEGNNPKELTLHQDWNIVDEKLYTSYQIWVPVDLSYPDNAGMFVVPGSHRFFDNYRSGSYSIPDVVADKHIRPYTVDMIIPPGHALVFHNSLFHASYPNHSAQNRVSAIISIYKKNAPLSYFQKNAAEGKTDVYRITPEIFLTTLNKLENGGIPDSYLSHSEAPLQLLENRAISSQDLAARYLSHIGGDAAGFEPLQRHILRDADTEQSMKKDGYVVLDFLSAETVEELKAEYDRLFKAPGTNIGRFTPMEHATADSKRYIHNFIIDKVRSRLDHYFQNYQTPIASFFTKYAHSTGDLSWHNDASLIINTHLEPHYGIWCPLIDVDESNGAFCLVEGSHKFCHSVYVDGIQWPFSQYISDFDRIGRVLHLRAGQMVLFDLRLIHNAVPNQSDQDRLVFAIRLTHTATRYYSFLCEDPARDAISMYEEKPDYYLRDDWSGANQAGSRNIKMGEMQHIYTQIDRAAIALRLKSETAAI
ncbi:MAG: phytanoyl-CoA dioxygenase family protein [Bacteroidetes bacterium]|nr:phytanoyl-CoA dioxygenase family protein [Bacteroidota bacterium]